MSYKVSFLNIHCSLSKWDTIEFRLMSQYNKKLSNKATNLVIYQIEVVCKIWKLIRNLNLNRSMLIFVSHECKFFKRNFQLQLRKKSRDNFSANNMTIIRLKQQEVKLIFLSLHLSLSQEFFSFRVQSNPNQSWSQDLMDGNIYHK